MCVPVTRTVSILWSGNGIFAINKPSGMISQLDEGKKPGGDYQGPMAYELVTSRIPGAKPGHRIDCFTSGILVIGADQAHFDYLFHNWHAITRKRYLAIICNPEWNSMFVDTPLADLKTGESKTAATQFNVLERGRYFSLVMCELVRYGRTHQIRRHLKSIGSPIVGDKVYGGAPSMARSGGQLLHAWQMDLQLPDPCSSPSRLRPGGEWVAIQAPIPEDFQQYPFDWKRWDAEANAPIKNWTIPAGEWKR